MIYNRKRLRADLESINPKLSAVCPGFHFEAEGRNNYTALDLYDGDSCETNIACGTPAECFSAACRYIVASMQVIEMDCLDSEKRMIKRMVIVEGTITGSHKQAMP